MRTFRLYPEERHWCSFADYGAILDATARLGARRVLEFGPGSSTLALIEGGATAIDCCESDPHWFAVYRERLEAAHPTIVAMQAYRWAAPLRIPQTDDKAYDLSLVDGPHETTDRPACIAYALERCSAVLVPLEEHSAPAYLRRVVEELAWQYGRTVEIVETGPLAGAYALILSP